MMDWNGLRVHFIGIGGSGMSGIARIVAARGGKVSGSDSTTLQYLTRFGLLALKSPPSTMLKTSLLYVPVPILSFDLRQSRRTMLR